MLLGGGLSLDKQFLLQHAIISDIPIISDGFEKHRTVFRVDGPPRCSHPMRDNQMSPILMSHQTRRDDLAFLRNLRIQGSPYCWVQEVDTITYLVDLVSQQGKGTNQDSVRASHESGVASDPYRHLAYHVHSAVDR